MSHIIPGFFEMLTGTKKKNAASTAQNSVPTAQDAQATAAQNVINGRRKNLLAGGATNLTGSGGAVLQSGQVQLKNLLGQ